MTFLPDDKSQPAPGRRQFVIVSEADPDRPIDWFEATDWAPAIMLYSEKIQSGAYNGLVWLREARPSELLTERLA